jgi:glycosyltransferase involved in cell wall biosynthesis
VASYPWWVWNESYGVNEQTWQSGLATNPVTGPIREVDPDVVMTQTVVVPYGALAAAQLGKPHVWSIREFSDKDHDLKLPLPSGETGLIISGLSSKVLTVSKAVRDHFFPKDAAAAKVLYPRPALLGLNPVKRERGSVWNLGIVASLQPGKGHTDAINAVASLLRRGIKVNLVCVGSGNQADLKRLTNLVSDLGIEDSVKFAGLISDNKEIYGMFDAVAVTSRAEAFGRVAFEATDTGNGPYVILNDTITTYFTGNALIV